MLNLTPSDGIEKYLCDTAYAQQSPIAGTFELIPTCNMNCKMCYVRLSNEEMEKAGKYLSYEEWMKVAQEAKDMGTLFVLLTGGEPMLHPQFKEIYKGLRKLGMIVTINTNGTLITDEIIDMFQEDLPRRVNISLYGSSSETYENLCRNGNAYHKVISVIHKMKDAGIPVKINYTLSQENYSDMQDMIEIANDLEVPMSLPTYTFPAIRKKGYTEVSNDPHRLTPQDAAKAQMEFLVSSFGHEPDFLDQMKHTLEQMKPKQENDSEPPCTLLCSAGMSHFWINWLGDMTACGMMRNHTYNVREMSFKDAWLSVNESVKTITTSAKCFHCRFRSVCHGCGMSAYAETGKYDGHTEYLCQLNEEYERLIQAYVKEQEGVSDGNE